MGNFSTEIVSSTGTEVDFLKAIYKYIVTDEKIGSGITCSITKWDDTESDYITINDAESTDIEIIYNKYTTIKFWLDTNIALIFQSYPTNDRVWNADSNNASNGCNITLIVNNTTVFDKTLNQRTWYDDASGLVSCISFVAPAYTYGTWKYLYPTMNAERKFRFSKYIDNNVFILWINSYSSTSFKDSGGVSIIKFRDTDLTWRWSGYTGPSPIENSSIYDSDGVNPATLSTIFSYEARNGYLDYISHSSFVSGSTKVFTSADIFDCSAVNIGDTFLLDDTHSYMAIGTHSLVPIDYNIIPPLIDKTITENGTYSAKDDGASGYSEVTVNVISYKNYIKFNGEGIMLPWSINSDYKIEVTFHETTYYNDSAIIGNSISPSDMHLTEYNNKYYFLQSRNGETNYGTWSAGEHTFIYNNGSGKNTLDGTVVSNFTPYNYSSALYSIGCRGGINSNVYNGWIKSYKIYSISQDELIHDLRPAIVAGYHCFIDVIDNAIYSNNSIQAVDTIT